MPEGFNGSQQFEHDGMAQVSLFRKTSGQPHFVFLDETSDGPWAVAREFGDIIVGKILGSNEKDFIDLLCFHNLIHKRLTQEVGHLRGYLRKRFKI
ncbi:MAG: hypothetical protein JWN25_591 [Verrucomicrobiales bacterium]|nr:hypothetical protein [Verrucomicrobiales bacterium]